MWPCMKTGQKGSMISKKVQVDSRRFNEVQEGQEGSRKFKKAQ